MKNKALYGFESESLGKGLAISQNLLEKLDLDLHAARPSAGGFLFLAFEGGTRPSVKEFRALVEGERALVLEAPRTDLISGLLHLQPTPSPGAEAALVLESRSPVSLLLSVHEHLALPGTGLFQLNLSHYNKAFAILAMDLKEGPEFKSIPVPELVTRTIIDKLSPKWRKDYFV